MHFHTDSTSHMTAFKGRKEMFYLTTHSTHFIYGYMASDIWLRTILIVRKETRCCHIGYSFRLTARVLLYAPSHRQDSTYHSLCYTSCGPPHEGSIQRPIAPWANALTTELPVFKIQTVGLWLGWKTTQRFGPLKWFSAVKQPFGWRKEMFYLTTHSTHFIYGYNYGKGPLR